jgi:hypothetical protein
MMHLCQLLPKPDISCPSVSGRRECDLLEVDGTAVIETAVETDAQIATAVDTNIIVEEVA